MAYVFNEQEKVEIEAARLKAPIGDRADAVNADGNWVVFYTTLSNILQAHLAKGGVERERQSQFQERQAVVRRSYWCQWGNWNA